ncbi:hypothetical protein ABS198_21530, partial [Acinetobacter baumannii]|uniref:hypothetical protein n=1 Tax=Acinetobacter baumannii TaxID=470 RepID=UPI00332F42FC
MGFRRLLDHLAVAAVAGLCLATASPAFASDPPATATTASAPAAPGRERVRMNRRVFDRVWNEVRNQYYDPGLHGVDWTA